MSKLIKVMMEFDDKVQTLEGAQAEKWLESVNAMCVMEHIHGRPFPGYKWKIVYKPGAKKPDDPRQIKFKFDKKG